MTRILITGGAGFIGYHLAHRLAADPANRIVLVDNLQRGEVDDEMRELICRKNVGFLHADLTEPDALDRDWASTGIMGHIFDEVYHLAAVNGTRHFYEAPDQVLRTNALSTVFLLDWLARQPRPPRLMFASSNEAYAGALAAFGQLPIPTPEGVPLVIADPYNPRWSYAATKLLGEMLVIHYASKRNIPSIIIRPHNFYGPRAGRDHVIPEMLARIAEREDPFVIAGPNETRSFCYIADAVVAMEKLMPHASTSAPTVHVGASGEITMRQLANKLFDVTGWCPLTADHRSGRAGSVARRAPELHKVRGMTGWEASTSLEDGLRATADWYARHPTP